MKVSLNWVRRYVDLPADLSNEQIAYDLTMRTVEVEDVINTADKFHDIVVGEIKELLAHPNADKLRVCKVDVGEEEELQIVCGGSNLYEGEKVVVSKPGAEVYWHGESELQLIKPTKMRGVASAGMICGASEVYLEGFYPPASETEIVDLTEVDCYPGQNVAELVGMNDTVLDIDNKSLTNRPDLWGHYGIARELAAIYKVPLKPLPEWKAPTDLPAYKIDIEDTTKCQRYAGLKIENVGQKEAPNWMKAAITNAGMRPINAIVDISNYVMLAVGQPTHAFDSTHVDEEHIIVRNAKPGEELELLNNENLALTESDLVISDVNGAIGLAGIRGGKKDSILPETTSVLLEVANFTAGTIRQTGKRFDEKTDAGIRYEKGIDTDRVDQGLAMASALFQEIFPECTFTAYSDNYPVHTERATIDVSKDFLDVRLGKVLTADEIFDILERLGYEGEIKEVPVDEAEAMRVAQEVSRSAANTTGIVYHVTAPTWRSTGDVSIHDDVLGDIARLLSYESFESKPLPVNFEHAVRQPQKSLDRKMREFLSYRCGFNEIFTYPWIDEKYIKAAKLDMSKAVRLATPPAPELANLRQSLVPGALEAVAKNLRYFDSFKIFEMAQTFEQGVYHESSEDETLPVHKMMLTGALVGKDAKELFFQAKGVIESLPRYVHMEGYTFKQKEKPSWADEQVYLNIINDKKQIIGSFGLVSVAVMNEAGIKRTQVAMFELDTDKLVPLPSRDNVFEHLPQFPLVEEDISMLVDETTQWADIHEAIKFMAKKVEFVEEYRGQQIPDGKKSVMLRVTMGNDDSTMTAKQIEKKMKGIMKALEKKVGAVLREE